MSRLITAVITAVIAVVVLLAYSVADAAVTKKTTPETIWLFAVSTPTAAGKAPYAVMYWFLDEKPCQAQADKWNAKLQPAKSIVCLPLSNKDAKPGDPHWNYADDSEE